jgi:gamma-glutamyl-gamma-aminobutyrate hydrolase PuuD
LKIGLTQRIFYHKDRPYDCIEHGWYSYLCRHDLVFVPNNPNQDFLLLADHIDALIITGGDDSAVRRVTEIRLATLMMQSRKPILGVCHGAFMLTDMLGGTVDRCDDHMDTNHAVDYMGLRYQVNSHHSQAIKRLHSTGYCLAQDEDGNCEAWMDGDIFGVVWHPERMQNPWTPPEIANRFQIA